MPATLLKGMQQAGGVRRQEALLALHRPRRHPTLCQEPRRAPARRQSPQGLA